MLELTDLERWQLVSTLLTAKFQSEKSRDLCGLEVINKVIKHCLVSPVTDPGVKFVFSRFKEPERWELEPLFPAILAAKDIKDAGLATSEKEIIDALSDCLFPYELTEKAHEQALKIINDN